MLLLYKICKAHGILPASYVIQREFISVGDIRCRGGSAYVRGGEYKGSPVAIKCLEVNREGSDRIFKVPSIDLARCRCSTSTQRLCREIIGWKHLSHPNILPLLGVFASIGPHRFSILTEWMPNGNVRNYAKSHPEANRMRLVSLLWFTNGYLPVYS